MDDSFASRSRTGVKFQRLQRLFALVLVSQSSTVRCSETEPVIVTWVTKDHDETIAMLPANYQSLMNELRGDAPSPECG